MAKRSTALATRSNVIVLSQPKRRGALRRRAGSALRAVRHHRTHAGGAKAPVTSIALGGLIVGYLQGKGMLDKLPVIGGSKTVTLGIAGYVVAKYVKNPTLKFAGVAALAVAAADFGRVQGGGTSGDIEGDVEGDDYVGDDTSGDE